jgi:hypothetical protein
MILHGICMIVDGLFREPTLPGSLRLTVAEG